MGFFNVGVYLLCPKVTPTNHYGDIAEDEEEYLIEYGYLLVVIIN